ncbi:MAG: ASKHA domain-containing protein [Candidatus Omnitrophica bacterium]|nr:ASKHA domain-containing protein [Candidatus Omnitrophota bacterium]
MEKFKVTFYPDNKQIEVAKDTSILTAAIACGIYLNSACGGDGVCGKCKVTVKAGKVITQPNGAISLEEKRTHLYLACLTTIHSDLEVEIPAQSRQDFQDLSAGEIDTRLKGFFAKSEEIDSQTPALGIKGFDYSPLVRKYYLELPVPSLEDNISDLERLFRQIAKHDPKVAKDLESGSNIQTGLANIKQLAEILRDADWQVTAILGNRDGMSEIIALEHGVCFDIGTTTISGQLVDLNSKKIVATKATYNKQASFGSDVITRIIFAEKENGLEKLHQTVIATLNEMILEFIGEHKISLNQIYCAVCAGNTTMIHLLLNIDPSYIRRQPYTPAANFIPTLRAAEANIHINPRGFLTCVPGISSYVGGDTTAGVLSSGLYQEDDVSLLIDIGTNGEIVLGNKDFLVACAASAGPAFEGSGVACGMRASKGAIQKVKIDRQTLKVDFVTIENAKPRGIGGSGYIDLLAEMLKAKIIEKDGKIKSTDPKRVREADAGKEFVVVFKADADAETDIVITEADIDNLKRAKAAIYAACAILARRLDLDFAAVKKIFIAGGFGTYLDMENAISIGLLPDQARSKFKFIGNSSLSGATLTVLSTDAAHKAAEIARKMTYLELSVEPEYMDEYMAALFFPHTDFSKFPSVRI